MTSTRSASVSLKPRFTWKVRKSRNPATPTPARRAHHRIVGPNRLGCVDTDRVTAASYADFTRARLPDAYLWGSDFRETIFFHADLRGADLRCAQLVGTDFRDADLTGWHLTDDATQLGNCCRHVLDDDDGRTRRGLLQWAWRSCDEVGG